MGNVTTAEVAPTGNEGSNRWALCRDRLLVPRGSPALRSGGTVCRPRSYIQSCFPRASSPVVDCSGRSAFARSSRRASATTAPGSTSRSGIQGDTPRKTDCLWRLYRVCGASQFS